MFLEMGVGVGTTAKDPDFPSKFESQDFMMTCVIPMTRSASFLSLHTTSEV